MGLRFRPTVKPLGSTAAIRFSQIPSRMTGMARSLFIRAIRVIRGQNLRNQSGNAYEHTKKHPRSHSRGGLDFLSVRSVRGHIA